MSTCLQITCATLLLLSTLDLIAANPPLLCSADLLPCNHALFTPWPNDNQRKVDMLAQVDSGGWQLADFFASHSSLDGGDELTVTVDSPTSHR